jgi:hypothetical protein
VADGTQKRCLCPEKYIPKTDIRRTHGIPLDEDKQKEFCDRLNNGEKLKDLRAEYKISYYFAKYIIESHGFNTPRKQKNNDELI